MPMASAAARACGATSWCASNSWRYLRARSSASTSPAPTSRRPAWCGKTAMPIAPAGRFPARSCVRPGSAGRRAAPDQHVELDGAPSPGDPRHALKRVVDRFAELNLIPVIAIELEFFLLDRTRGEERPAAAAGVAGERLPAQPIAGLSADRSRRSGAVPGGCLRACEAQGLPAQTPDLRIRAGPAGDRAASPRDALRAVDDAIMYKRLCAASPPSIGMDATFMAKALCRQLRQRHAHACEFAGRGRPQRLRKRRSQGNALLRHATGGHGRDHAEASASSRPTPIPIAGFRRNPTPRWRRPGASTNRSAACACRRDRRRLAMSSTASPAPMRIRIWRRPPCWRHAPRHRQQARSRSRHRGQRL